MRCQLARPALHRARLMSNHEGLQLAGDVTGLPVSPRLYRAAPVRVRSDVSLCQITPAYRLRSAAGRRSATVGCLQILRRSQGGSTSQSASSERPLHDGRAEQLIAIEPATAQVCRRPGTVHHCLAFQLLTHPTAA